jgi:hypothetical protein
MILSGIPRPKPGNLVIAPDWCLAIIHSIVAGFHGEIAPFETGENADLNDNSAASNSLCAHPSPKLLNPEFRKDPKQR